MVRTKANKMQTNTRFDSLKDSTPTTKARSSRREGRRNKSNSRNNHKSNNHLESKKKPASMGFSINSEAAFPELCSETKTKESTATTMNYASAAKPEEQVTIVDEVDPGWVKIVRHKNNKIVYKYNNKKHNREVMSTVNQQEPQQEPLKGLDEEQEEHLYLLTKHWQYYRDLQNTQYPNTSPFMDTKNLLEELSDDCYETESDVESESDISLEDPEDFDDDF